MLISGLKGLNVTLATLWPILVVLSSSGSISILASFCFLLGPLHLTVISRHKVQNAAPTHL